jgi:tripartite-type tricarboxylate transporter receptor subunit TctC
MFTLEDISAGALRPVPIDEPAESYPQGQRGPGYKLWLYPLQATCCRRTRVSPYWCNQHQSTARGMTVAAPQKAGGGPFAGERARGGLSMRAVKLFLAAAIAATAAFTVSASAQSFPSKPVNVIMPYPTGTGPDTVQRMVNEKLQSYWGQPVTIENRPGSNYWAAAEAFKKAAPDGYTLFQTENWMLALQPHVFKKLPYDPIKDFVPVVPMFEANQFLVVKADSPWKSVADLIAAAMEKEGQLTYGSSGVASTMHMGGVKLETAAGIKMTHVPVKETPQIFTSIANGELSLALGSASTSGPMLRAGKVKYLAIADTKRNPGFPYVPTFAEAGGPANFVHKSWLALYAPPGTPTSIVDKINADVARALNEPDVREKMAAIGFTPYTSTPEELAKALADETKAMGEIAKSNNISLD